MVWYSFVYATKYPDTEFDIRCSPNIYLSLFVRTNQPKWANSQVVNTESIMHKMKAKL